MKTINEEIKHYEQQISHATEMIKMLKELRHYRNRKSERKKIGRCITKEQAEWAYEQWLVYGYPYHEIAKLFFVARSTLTRAIDSYGIQRLEERPELELPSKFTGD